ncbi:unnamed protein product [Allacma fusca]|uniref:Uncharacterized protein n=1 Tax=Allacma fusca TaxID=39272 RepID=A0A8J2NL80_9HEXA|nr:unnamed protein product [Allacma fusca]
MASNAATRNVRDWYSTKIYIPEKYSKLYTPKHITLKFIEKTVEQEDFAGFPPREKNFVENGRGVPVKHTRIFTPFRRLVDYKTIDQSVFQVTPWDLKQKQQVQAPSTSWKVRPRQSSELMTSEEMVAKLKAKDLEKRKTRSSSDSEERRLTRNLDKSQKRELRSAKLN